MDEVSVVIPTTTNQSGGGGAVDWWAGASEEDALSPLPLDASEGGLWGGTFVPPPPRPLFLDESATPDGLTTCDLCSWAWQAGNGGFVLDKAMEAPGELGWVLTMVIVSLISATIGAIIMIIVLHCKRRIKGSTTNDAPPSTTLRPASRPPISTPDDKSASPPHTPPNGGSVWAWLSRRPVPPRSQLANPSATPAENHYTHMDEEEQPYAIYAELDRQSNSPAYQNSAYTDAEGSAPSSAYYSDLSAGCGVQSDRAYEVVGLQTLPVWEGGEGKRQPRLAAISEGMGVPSDYV